MSKKISKINFIIVSVLVAIGIFLSVCSFNIPFGVTSDYAGFINAISLNYDMGKGNSVVYKMTPVDTQVETLSCEQKNGAVKFVRNTLAMFDSSFNQVGLQDENCIRANVKSTDFSSILLSALAEREEIVIRGEETTEKTDYDINANRIKKCSISYQQISSTSASYSYGVVIEFDSLGTKQYKELTKYVSSNGNTIFFYNQDGEQVGKLEEITKQISTGVTFLPQDSVTNENDVRAYAAQVMMGACHVKLTVKEMNLTSAYLGNNTALYIAIAMGVAFVVIMALLIVRYRDLGLIGMLTSFVNAILMLFFLQALPANTVKFSLTGVYGLCLGFAITLFANIIVFEKIRKNYATGKNESKLKNVIIYNIHQNALHTRTYCAIFR